uniref:Secreted protein n=1 Tax=Peronospora matthiolae TaxID=2874970 RepID=A0AAV1UN69_9STRA
MKGARVKAVRLGFMLFAKGGSAKAEKTTKQSKHAVFCLTFNKAHQHEQLWIFFRMERDDGCTGVYMSRLHAYVQSKQSNTE